jgi:pimeloyl-ACP methyl ester carboxylesterase
VITWQGQNAFVLGAPARDHEPSVGTCGMTMKTKTQRSAGWTLGPFSYVPVRHGPRPVPQQRANKRPRPAWAAGSVAALAVGVDAGLAAGSVTLGVFWALLAGYVVRLLFAPGTTVVHRLVLAAIASGIAIGVLAVTVSQWGRSWLAIAVALAAGGLVSAVAGWLWRPEFTPSILGADGTPLPGSIATMEKVRLGGVNQWIVIRGRSAANPVLLMLAGGPGGSELASFRKHNGALEDHFVVVYWEQRGAGKSFPLLLRDRKRMTRQQYLDDGLELADYLRRRFGQDKIFLVGHSWGTFLGLWMAQREPGWFWAYVGIGQMVNAVEGDQLFYDLTLARARREGDQRTVTRLVKTGRPPYSGNPVTVARKIAKVNLSNWRYMNADIRASGGTPTAGLLADMAGIPEYRPLDHLYTLAGTALTYGTVYPQLEAEGVDLVKQVPELQVPVYLAEGRWDINAPPALAEHYLGTLTAPAKHLQWFEHSGHNPCYEEPEHFNTFMTGTVLAQATVRRQQPS